MRRRSVTLTRLKYARPVGARARGLLVCRAGTTVSNRHPICIYSPLYRKLRRNGHVRRTRRKTPFSTLKKRIWGLKRPQLFFRPCGGEQKPGAA